MAQPYLYRLIDKAVHDFNMIEPGDKILIGASGGKDSTALIEYFANRRKRPSENFEIQALNIHSEIGGRLPQKIRQLFQQWNVPCIEMEINMKERMQEGRKLGCYWCATQRRTELIRYALNNGFTKLALGHHMDDILETWIMNAVIHGVNDTMPPNFQYDKYPLKIIRPLFFASEETIIEYGAKQDYLGFTCTCNFIENGARKNARKRLEFLTDGQLLQKQHLFKAILNKMDF